MVVLNDNLFGKILFAVIGVPMGLLIFWAGFKRFQLKRLVENTPTSKIRSIAMGFVEVLGEVGPFQKTLTAPFTGKNCVWYRYVVEEWQKTGKSSKWRDVMRGEDRAHFFVKDDSGAVLVDSAGAEVDVESGLKSEMGGLDEATRDRVRKFVEERKVNLFGGILSIGGLGRRMRFTEYCIEPGNNLYVMGVAGNNPFVKEGAVKEGYEAVMIQKGKNHPFYINDKPEKGVLKSLGWQSIALIAVGAAFSVISVAVLLSAFGLL